MPRVVVFDEFGGPDVLRLAEEPLIAPGPGEVRVRIEAFAVNPLDLMARSGTSPAPIALPRARLGVEGTGVVDALGPAVTAVAVGDLVIITAIPDAAANGSYAEFVTLPEQRVIRRPLPLDATEAAAIWVGFSTAYGALVETAGMRPGDRVLINAASGSVGRAAIQLANHLGAVPIAITRSAAKRDALVAWGAAHVVATETEDVADAVGRLTRGAGADLALDLVMGPAQQELVRATREGGTLVVAGFLDSRPTPFPAKAPLTMHRYRGFDLLLDPVAVGRMAAFLAAAVRLGALRPAVERVFTLDEVAEAHRYLESGAHGGGKVVVTV